MNWKTISAGCIVGVLAVALLGTTASYGETKAQKMLKAKRGAQVDAYRNLSELIKGLKISSDTYVRDFVTESDEIRTQFDDFIQGAKVIGPPRFVEEADGSLTAEVDVKVTLEQVLQGLAQISYNRGPNKPPLDLTYMKEHTREKEFISTGRANTGRNAPPPGMIDETAEQGAVSAGHYGVRSQSPVAGIRGWENVTGQGRLKAERAAITDARRNLAETVEGLRISGDTYVRDFVTESDEVRTSLNAFIKGVKQIGPYRYYEDGIVEVDVQVTIQDVIKELEKVRQHLVQQGHHWQRDIFRTVTFEKIVGWSEKRVIKATGSGTVHEMDYFDKGPAQESYGPPPNASWARRIVTAKGVGIPAPDEQGPAARIKAERAAEMDARRNLVEQVYGVNINASTTVRDFVLQNDEVNTDVTAYLAGARRVGEPVYNQDGSVEVTVELDLEGLASILNRR